MPFDNTWKSKTQGPCAVAGGTNVSLFVGGDEDGMAVGKGGINTKSTSTNLKFIPILALSGLTAGLAIMSPNLITAYVPFLLVASKVGKPRNKVEVVQVRSLPAGCL